MSKYGYVDDTKIVEHHLRKEKERAKGKVQKRVKKDILKEDREILYDFKKEVSENLTDGKDKYIILKISEDDDSIEKVPDEFAKILTKPQSLLKENVPFLKYIVVDYDTLFGVRYNQIKNYNSKVFSLSERVLFETLIIKFKRNQFKPFQWPKNKIGYELGIKRRTRDTILNRFIELGIIKSMKKVEKFSKEKGSPIKTTLFDLNPKKIIELLPCIFSNFTYKKMEEDILKYLKLQKK